MERITLDSLARTWHTLSIQQPFVPLFLKMLPESPFKPFRRLWVRGWCSQVSCILETGAFALIVILPTKNLQGLGLASYPDKAAVYSPKARNSSYKCPGVKASEKRYISKFTEKSNPKGYQGR